MAKASRANCRPPNPLPTLPLPPTRHRHHRQCPQPPPCQLLPDNDKHRGATTSPIATTIVNVTAPTLPLHRLLPPRRRSCPLCGLSNEHIGRGRNSMLLRLGGQRQRRWLRQRRCVGEGERPGEGEGGQWTLVRTTFGLAEWRKGKRRSMMMTLNRISAMHRKEWLGLPPCRLRRAEPLWLGLRPRRLGLCPCGLGCALEV
jgi:hypothetical protein